MISHGLLSFALRSTDDCGILSHKSLHGLVREPLAPHRRCPHKRSYQYKVREFLTVVYIRACYRIFCGDFAVGINFYMILVSKMYFIILLCPTRVGILLPTLVLTPIFGNLALLCFPHGCCAAWVHPQTWRLLWFLCV